jgi:hypothetical protein
MKKRVLEIVDSKNKSTFYPQRKLFFIWFNFKDAHGCPLAFTTLYSAKDWLSYKAEDKKRIYNFE